MKTTAKEMATFFNTSSKADFLPKKVFNASNCGDNCAEYLLELAKDRDIKVTLHHAMDFGTDFSVKVINEGKRKVISDPIEFLMLAHHYLKEVQDEG